MVFSIRALCNITPGSQSESGSMAKEFGRFSQNANVGLLIANSDSFIKGVS